MKKGFTLSEMVVTIGVVGVLALILIPVLRDAMPNQEQAMFKKAYYIIERSVSELINDEDLYPEAEEGQTNYFGNTVEVTYKDITASGSSKFCKLFTSKLNRTSDVVCEASEGKTLPTKFTDGVDPIGTMTTADGIVWLLPDTVFADNTTPQEIYVDVNGKKKPNCFYDKTTCKKPDRFTVKVYQDGRVLADGTMEIEYLNKVSIGKNSKAETDQAKKDELEESGIEGD